MSTTIPATPFKAMHRWADNAEGRAILAAYRGRENRDETKAALKRLARPTAREVFKGLEHDFETFSIGWAVLCVDQLLSDLYYGRLAAPVSNLRYAA